MHLHYIPSRKNCATLARNWYSTFREKNKVTSSNRLSRRAILAGSGASLGLLAAPSIVRAQARDIRIGYITALTGARAEFGESDPWMLEQVKKITDRSKSVV